MKWISSSNMVPTSKGQPTSFQMWIFPLSLFEMLWGAPQFDVSEQDWKEVQCLCRADSVNFILDLPDYYGFFTYSLFQGTVVKNGATHENNPQKLFRSER